MDVFMVAALTAIDITYATANLFGAERCVVSIENRLSLNLCRLKALYLPIIVARIPC